MAKFIYQHATPNEFRYYFGNATVYGDGEDIKLDYNSQLICLHTDVNGVAIRVRIGTVSDFSELPRLGSYIVDFAFSGKKVNAQEYGHLCAVAGAMLVAQGQKVLDGGGYKSDSTLSIFGAPYQDVKTATQKILSGCFAAKMSVLTIVEQDTTGNNPAIRNWEGLSETVWAGAAIN